MTTHDDLIRRATNAYLRWYRDHGCPEQQPSNACSRVDGDTIVLANDAGMLASYQLLGNGRLVKLDQTSRSEQPQKKPPMSESLQKATMVARALVHMVGDHVFIPWGTFDCVRERELELEEIDQGLVIRFFKQGIPSENQP